MPLSGLDFFLDFSADPLNEQPHYQVILGTGGANPALPFGHMGSFLVQPFPFLLPWPSSPPAWRCYDF